MRHLILTLACLLPLLSGCGRTYYPDPVPEPAEVEKITKALTTSPTGDATAPAAATVGTGWATLKGKLTLTAAAPTAGELLCNKDNATCCKEKLIDDSLVVGPGNGVANVFVYLKSKKDLRVHESYSQAEGAEVLLDNVKCMFKPHAAIVWTKQKLVLKNSDDVGHNTNLQGNNGFNEVINAGATSTRTFKKGDNLPNSASCSIHPWMKSYLLVRDNPYFALTNDAGEFTLTNLPAGEELEVVVWHERADALAGTSGSLTLVKGKLKVKLAENSTAELNLAFDPSVFGGKK